MLPQQPHLSHTFPKSSACLWKTQHLPRTQEPGLQSRFALSISAEKHSDSLLGAHSCLLNLSHNYRLNN